MLKTAFRGRVGVQKREGCKGADSSFLVGSGNGSVELDGKGHVKNVVDRREKKELEIHSRSLRIQISKMPSM